MKRDNLDHGTHVGKETTKNQRVKNGFALQGGPRQQL